MKLFSVELDNINGVMIPRVELDVNFKELDSNNLVNIHELISDCYKKVMDIYIKSQSIY